MERKLVSIQRVSALTPIEGADVIEAATVGGWRVVVKRGEFQVGDLAVYFEIDSILPDHPVFSFLWDKSGEGIARPSNYRLKTVKLRGVVSQGLLVPVYTLQDAGLLVKYTGITKPSSINADGSMNMITVPGVIYQYAEGEDVTAPIGVEKWEPPVEFARGDTRGQFIPFIPKTDETRVQSLEGQGALQELQGLPYAITLKLDGTSSTFGFDPRTNEFHAMSRNWSMRDGANIYWTLARKYNLESVLEGTGYAVQGEIVGPSIQGNKLGLKSPDLRVFSVYDMTNSRYLPHNEVMNFCEQNNLTMVPVLEIGDTFTHSQDSLLQLAEGKYEGTTNEREGLVIRALDGRESASLGGRLSIKAISNRFLLKGGE